MLATEIGNILHKKTIFAEKKVVSLNGQKEISELVINRHDLDTGDHVVIIEDVCNNFSTTEKLRKEIKRHGGVLKAIICAVNRSGYSEWDGIPVISALYIPTQQFKQDDPDVAGLVAKNKIIWKPKQEWYTITEISG